MLETVYFTEHGLYLHKRGKRILVKQAGKVIEEIPIRDLKRVVMTASCQVSSALLQLLTTHGIDVAFLSSQNRFRALLLPTNSRNIHLRLAQYQRYYDADFRLALGKRLIVGKIKNQRSLLVRYQRSQRGAEIQVPLERLRAMLGRVSEAQDIKGLMGVEGMAAKNFFAAYATLLKNGYTMNGRKYHPAPDPINSLLSFGYMLLLNEVQGTLESYGFEPVLGFLHGISHARASLAMDLMEEFRSPIVDRLVLLLVNKQCIKSDEFEKSEQYGMRMTGEALKTYLANYDNCMTTPFTDQGSGEKKNFRQIIREQVAKLEETLLNGNDYSAFVFSS